MVNMTCYMVLLTAGRPPYKVVEPREEGAGQSRDHPHNRSGGADDPGESGLVHWCMGGLVHWWVGGWVDGWMDE